MRNVNRNLVLAFLGFLCLGAVYAYADGVLSGIAAPAVTATISGALPAGTNNIGDVDVLTEPATGVEDVAETAGGALKMVGTVRRDVAASSAGATGDNATANTDALGLAWARFLDPCSGVAKVVVPIDIVTAATTELANASASNKLYVCHFHVLTDAANDVALVEDDTDACASPTAGMAGGVTAAEGWNFAASTGIALGTGNGTVMATAATNRYVCLITSAATQLSGTLVYALAP